MAQEINKILIVDDNPHIINRIVDILSEYKQEYVFFQANNGEIAYKIAKDKLPDIIITDWDMPKVNGIELINSIKGNEKTKEIPIIMATAVMQTSEDLRTALNAGAVDYIRKPIDAIELCARVESVLKISEYNKKILENKNREIAENALLLIRNNKFNIQIIKILEDLQQKIPNKTDELENLFEFIIKSIKDKVEIDAWQKFEIVFKSAHEDFSRNLLESFPTLSNSEMKLCILLKLGMNTKDIASVLFQTQGSIRVSRSRLRKKLNIEPNQSLITFLASF